MNFLKLPLTFSLIFSLLAIPVAGQHKHRAPKRTASKRAAAPPPQPKLTPAGTPAPTPEPTPAPEPVTFENLLAADSFKLYVEARGVGQLVQSSAANELLDPILKLGGPEKEFVTFINWLKAHADQLTTSRLLVAAWPNLKDLPAGVMAIEFASAEEATKFESQLNRVLATVMPSETPTPDPKSKETPAPIPAYFLQRADALVLLSLQPVQLKKLRPAGSKPWAEDPNFSVAYNKFSSEPLFLFIDFKAIEKETQERRKQYEEEQKKAEEARKAIAEKQKEETEEESEAGGEMEAAEEIKEAAEPSPSPEASPEASPKEPAQAEELSAALSMLRYSIFSGPPNMPDALGVGLSPENESLNVRALMIDSAGETSDPVPIFAGLQFGAPISPESPSVLPADSEVVLTMSLNFEEIYARAFLMEPPTAYLAADTSGKPVGSPTVVVQPELTPLTTLERLLKIKIKEELMPALGSEIAVALPLSQFNFFGPPTSYPRPQPQTDGTDPKPESNTPVVVISLRDKEAMRQLMPKILEGFAGKAATMLAQTERREDTELVSFANAFAYAFVGNFLVLSGDAAATRRVVDSYLKGETLAADPQFRNSTRWQPHLIQGQVYLSPALMESYKTWASSLTAQIGDDARSYMMRLTATPEPITYSLSNDGLGALHELHFPKNLAVLAVAGIASTENPPDTVKNERATMGTMWTIANAQRTYKEQKGSRYGSLEELIAADMLSKERLEGTGYKVEITLTAEGFAVTAVPIEYGKTGKLSFFLDESGTIRGGDHAGAPATASDRPLGY